MNNFELLKQSFPISQYDRECDGYKFIMENLPKEVRVALNIDDSKLQKIINAGEKYMYRVAKEEGKFKYMCFSLSNFEIIRKHIFLLTDET